MKNKKKEEKHPALPNEDPVEDRIKQVEHQVIELVCALEGMQERVEEAEIHINLLTRFITTVCVEKMGMRVGVLKRLLKRVEEEAMRDSEVVELEHLYHINDNDTHPDDHEDHDVDPWDEVA